MNKILKEKIKESIQSIFPVTSIVIIMCFILGVPRYDIYEFIGGAILLTIGLILFSIGASASMMTIAKEIGGYITKKRNLLLLIGITFIIGFLITIAEPSLWVLGEQFDAIPTNTLIITVAIGIGLFLIIALLRIVLQLRLSYILIICYSLSFIIALFIPSEFVPVAFDSGGFSTGPMSVPFIIALGVGVSYERGEAHSDDDSFGLIGISSIGPIIVVLILSLFYKSSYTSSSEDLNFIGYIIKYLINVGFAIIPFLVLFVVFQIFAFKLNKRKVIRILIGYILTYLGLVIFLVGADSGFVSVGNFLGKEMISIENKWLIIPLGMLIGFTIVAAEPAVQVLTKQVEEITIGAISRKLMLLALAIGVSFAIGFACLRILTGISIWWILLPGYLIALSLTFFVPKIFTAIAFDSGGAVTGALTTTFLVPFALGASSIIYGKPEEILATAYGLVAFVAMAPFVTIQVLGFIYNIKTRKLKVKAIEEEIINLQEVENETIVHNS